MTGAQSTTGTVSCGGLALIVTAVLAVLKLVGVGEYSWFIVALPVLVIWGFSLIVVAVVAFVAGVAALITKGGRK